MRRFDMARGLRPSGILLLLILGCSRPAPPPVAVDARERAAQFLIGRQSDDGAWRSNHYGSFKDGPSLTPFALLALRQTPASPKRDEAIRKGAAYLSSLTRQDGTIDDDKYKINYPVYTAAQAVVFFSALDDPPSRTARNAWLAYLKKQQLTEDLGWREADREYGGWGYSLHIPRKPQPGETAPPTEANLSATVFALDALRAAGCPTIDPAYRKALVFVQRCQNFPDDPEKANPRYDDGGFHFIYDDAARNKAGKVAQSDDGKVHYLSYGSASADGLRGLLHCGLPTDNIRVIASRLWFDTHFQPDRHPGNYPPEREPSRQGVYFYYTCSAARTLQALGQTPSDKSNSLAAALRKLQREDGSWANPVEAQREDDPMVATCFAIIALGHCQP